jgi:serine/threonine-protein kinase
VQQGDLIQDRYLLEAPLGTGGMAEVWRAQDRRLERPVAIKLMAPHLADDPGFLVRFFSEAQGAARVSDPAVVRVLDFGDQEGLPYLVMELVPGGSLAMPEGEKLLPERALELVSQAARGAGAAHMAGLVHRDIKPANILLDQEGNAKLADFGIASSTAGERMTATGAAIGSPHYISPEQVSGAVATPRSDVYALGVVLYELLTERKPFEGGNATMIAIAHIDQLPESPLSIDPTLDPAVDGLVMRCLAKDPQDRFEDGCRLADAIDRVRAGEAPLPLALESARYTDEWEPAADASVSGRRLLVGGIAAVLVLGLAAWGVAEALHGSTSNADASTTHPTPGTGPKARPKASPSASASAGVTAGLVSNVASPSPSSSTEAGTSRKPGGSGTVSSGGTSQGGTSGSNTAGGSGGTGPASNPGPKPSPVTQPSPTPGQPSPTPSAQPSQQPSPEPTPTTDPSPGPGPSPNP